MHNWYISLKKVHMLHCNDFMNIHKYLSFRYSVGTPFLRYFIGHIDYYERSMNVSIGVGISCVLAIAIVSGIGIWLVKRRKEQTPIVQQEGFGNELLEENNENVINEMLPKII